MPAVFLSWFGTSSEKRLWLWHHFLGKIVIQEGQHPLTGQRAANFRLLANKWSERRLVTQCHGCRAMRRSVCNAGASNASRSLCVQISRERSYPLPIYWYHSKGNFYLFLFLKSLIALQLGCWQFLYNETLQQTFRPVLSKLSKRRQIYVLYPHFEKVRGGIEPWLMARWKARVDFLLSLIDLLFLSLTIEALQGKMCQNSLPSGGVGQFELRFQGERVVPCQ